MCFGPKKSMESIMFKEYLFVANLNLNPLCVAHFFMSAQKFLETLYFRYIYIIRELRTGNEHGLYVYGSRTRRININ